MKNYNAKVSNLKVKNYNKGRMGNYNKIEKSPLAATPDDIRSLSATVMKGRLASKGKSFSTSSWLNSINSNKLPNR